MSPDPSTDPTTGPPTDPTTGPAMDRLRAADPAAAFPPLGLTANDILDRVGEDTLVDRVARPGRTRWLVPLVAAAVALLVVGGFLISNGLSDQDAPIAGTPAGPPQVAANCDVGAEPSNAPPTQAVSVSLCDRSEEEGLRLSAPPDALVDGIDQLITAFDALDAGPADFCTADLGPRYALVFTAADGTTTAVEGELYGCGTIGERTGAADYLAQFTQLLLEQRADRGPWTGEVEAGCEAGSWISASPDDADRAGFVCLPNEDGTFRTVALDSDDLAVLRADLIENTGPVVEQDTCFDRVKLVLTTSYGDQLRIDVACASFGEWHSGVRGGADHMWTLSPESSKIIERVTQS